MSLFKIFPVSSSNTLTHEIDSIGTTRTDALIIQNTTAAALNSVQYSPSLTFTGHDWNTSTGDKTMRTSMFLVPTQNSGSPFADIGVAFDYGSGSFNSPVLFFSGWDMWAAGAVPSIKGVGDFYLAGTTSITMRSNYTGAPNTFVQCNNTTSTTTGITLYSGGNSSTFGTSYFVTQRSKIAQQLSPSVSWSSGSSATQYQFGTGAGSNSTPTAITVIGGDSAGSFTFTPSASPSGAGATIMTLHFANGFTNPPFVCLSAGNSNAVGTVINNIYATSTTTAATIINQGSALTQGTAYTINWFIMGYV